MHTPTMNKERWVGLFRELGLSEEQMGRWHALFEARYPEGHQDFLSWLGLAPDEIAHIRGAGNR